MGIVADPHRTIGGRIVPITMLGSKTPQKDLEVLKKELAEATHRNLPPSVLINRYYLPIFKAAVNLTDVMQAESIRQKIVESDIDIDILPEWWLLNFELDRKRSRLPEAENWAKKLCNWAKNNGNKLWEGVALHAMGLVYEHQRKFDEANIRYKQSIDVMTHSGYNRQAAGSYFHLGVIAGEQNDFDLAAQWYQKAMVLHEALGNEHGAANTYLQLGRIAQKRLDFDAAVRWYTKSMNIFEKINDESGAASIYSQLGNIAIHRKDLEAAKRWYEKAAHIEEKLENGNALADCYYNLALIERFQHHLDEAERWCWKSLKISDWIGNQLIAANNYLQLGIFAQERHDFEMAEQWYKKSRHILETLQNEHGLGFVYRQLGILADIKKDDEAAGEWFIRSLGAFKHTCDPEALSGGTDHFIRVFRKSSPDIQAKLKRLWKRAALGPFPEPIQE